MPYPRNLDWCISYCDIGSSNATLMLMCHGLLSRSSAYGVVWLETVYVMFAMWDAVRYDDVM